METMDKDALARAAQRIRNGAEQMRIGMTEWIDGVMNVATGMLEGREQFPDNIGFSHWMVDNDLDVVGPNERAILLKWARKPKRARTMLEDLVDQRIAIETVWGVRQRWAVMKDLWEEFDRRDAGRLNTDVKTTPEREKVESVTKTEPKVVSDSRAPVTAKSEPATDHESIINLFERPHAKTLLRKALAGRGGREIAEMLSRSIAEGFLTGNTVSPSNMSLRVILPGCTPSGVGASMEARYASTFDLAVPADRKRFNDDVWPAIMADKAAFLADQTRLETIVRAYVRNRAQAEQKKAHGAKVVSATRSLPASERQVIMFGEPLWPRVDEKHGVYDYAQLKTAVATFRDLWRWMWRDDVKGRGIQVRQSLRWYTEYADASGLPLDSGVRTVWRLVNMLSRLAEANPDETGNRYPE